ncbi:MAG: hypothetical protein ACFFCW_44645 [Candidatus Hodarchaeota archaeon]
MPTKAIVAIVLVVVGLVLILAVPTAYEGPLLLSITEQHAIRLVDAIGLAVAILSWIYLNFYIVQLWTRRRKLRNPGTDDTKQDYLL